MALAIKCDICGMETTERYDLCPLCYENMKKHIEHEKEVPRRTLVRDITYIEDCWTASDPFIKNNI